MRILLIGSTGMLGQALQEEAQKRNIEAIGVARNDSDICIDISNETLLRETVLKTKPNVIINAAAITNLGLCEADPGYAYKVNARPAGILTDLCRKNNSYFIQISTDHYFCNDGVQKHAEGHPVRLLNEYARTKFAAEAFALTYENALIVRTNIVGFRGRAEQPTFAEWVIQTVQAQHPITLFNDFYTSSITAGELSRALFKLLLKGSTGVLNVASREVTSKETFIRKIAARLDCSVNHARIGSVNAVSAILRANSLGLDVAKAELVLGEFLPSADEVVENLIEEYRGRNPE